MTNLNSWPKKLTDTQKDAVDLMLSDARERIVIFLASVERADVGEIVEAAGLSRLAVSTNLAWLEDRGLVSADKKKHERLGKAPRWMLNDEEFVDSLAAWLSLFPHDRISGPLVDRLSTSRNSGD